MSYKRPNIQKPAKPHPVYAEWKYLRQLTDHDAGWVYPHLTDMLDEARVSLHGFQSVLNNALDMDMSELKPAIAKEKRAQMILDARKSLLGWLKRPIEKYKSEMNAVSNKILRITEPDKPSDPVKAMLQEMRFREIRDNLKNIEPKKRRDAVAGNIERMQAIITNPDPSDIIIAPEALTELRREFAFRQDPSLIEQEKDQKEIYKAVRGKAGEINATASMLLIHAKVDDPISPAEHFSVFEPLTEHESIYANQRIHEWDKRAAQAAKLKAFNEQNDGINLGRRERVARIERGIPH